MIDKIPAFSRLLGLLCPITEHLRKLATKFVVTSSTEINFPVLMSIWPEDGLLISDKHPLFLFMSVVFFGGVFLVNKRRGLSNFLSPVLSPDAVSSHSERWYTSLRDVI